MLNYARFHLSSRIQQFHYLQVTHLIILKRAPTVGDSNDIYIDKPAFLLIGYTMGLNHPETGQR